MIEALAIWFSGIFILGVATQVWEAKPADMNKALALALFPFMLLLVIVCIPFTLGRAIMKIMQADK